MNSKCPILVSSLLSLAVAADTMALPQDDVRPAIAELERRIEVLSSEAERQRLGDVYVPVGESAHGLGPAASKIYHRDRGVSIGGYGEMVYQNHQGSKTDTIDFWRAVLYFGHRYNERWLLNTEFEFEHGATDKAGTVSVEFAYLDYLWNPALSFRAGMLLVPMGFINEYHEPTTFFGASRPDIERLIIPSTWRENGAGVFGAVGGLAYKAYIVNGLRADGFSPSQGVRSGRQKGSKALADNFAGVARVDWTCNSLFTIGGSAYYGDSGQNIGFSVNTVMAELHAELEWQGWRARALAAAAKIGNVAALNRMLLATAINADGTERSLPDAEIESIGERISGYYGEIGYNLLQPWNTGEVSFTPFARRERYDMQDRIPAGFNRSGHYDIELWTFGVEFKPIHEVVFKADYQRYDASRGPYPNQFNLAVGYIF